MRALFEPLFGDPRECRAYEQFRRLTSNSALFGPREGRGEVATSDFVPLCWGCLRTQGLHTNSALLWDIVYLL